MDDCAKVVVVNEGPRRCWRRQAKVERVERDKDGKKDGVERMGEVGVNGCPQAL